MGSSHATSPQQGIDGLIGFWSLDVRTKIMSLDAGISEYYGIDFEEGARGVHRDRLLASIWSEDHASLLARVQQAIEARTWMMALYRIQTPRGETLWVRSMGRCFLDANGVPTHLSGVLLELAGEEGAVPLEQLVDRLASARDIADRIGETTIAGLVEVVMAEVGRRVASRLGKGRF